MPAPKPAPLSSNEVPSYTYGQARCLFEQKCHRQPDEQRRVAASQGEAMNKQLDGWN